MGDGEIEPMYRDRDLVRVIEEARKRGFRTGHIKQIIYCGDARAIHLAKGDEEQARIRSVEDEKDEIEYIMEII